MEERSRRKMDDVDKDDDATDTDSKKSLKKRKEGENAKKATLGGGKG